LRLEHRRIHRDLDIVLIDALGPEGIAPFIYFKF
jgi:hypothetical protein